MSVAVSSSASSSHETRDRLIRAGVYFFETRGYHGTGVAAILARAKTVKGSFYHHFPDGKEELAVASLEWLEGEVIRYLDGMAQRGCNSKEMVEGIVRHAALGIRTQESRRGSLLAALAQDAAPDSSRIARALKQYAGAVRQRLAAARNRECPGENGSGFADQALAMVQGASVLARVDGNANRAIEIVAAWLQGQG
jgi:TetR/AcrR family transcriptional repressor of lmrAB and yxaGH operons